MIGSMNRDDGDWLQDHWQCPTKPFPTKGSKMYFILLALCLSICQFPHVPSQPRRHLLTFVVLLITLPFNLLLILSTRLLMSVRQPSISHLNLVLQNIKQ